MNTNNNNMEIEKALHIQGLLLEHFFHTQVVAILNAY